MKKLSAILLLLLFIFNLAGYRAWFYYQELKSSERLQATVDRNEYDEKDLITIKVPLSLPYFTNWKEFERYDGTIEVNGKHFNYVKRKVSNDTLILLCIPNQEQNRLTQSKKIFENLVSNGQSPTHNNKPGTALLFNSLFSTYRQADISYQLAVLPKMLYSYTTSNNNITAAGSALSPWQPPDINS